MSMLVVTHSGSDENAPVHNSTSIDLVFKSNLTASSEPKESSPDKKACSSASQYGHPSFSHHIFNYSLYFNLLKSTSSSVRSSSLNSDTRSEERRVGKEE